MQVNDWGTVGMLGREFAQGLWSRVCCYWPGVRAKREADDKAAAEAVRAFFNSFAVVDPFQSIVATPWHTNEEEGVVEQIGSDLTERQEVRLRELVEQLRIGASEVYGGDPVALSVEIVPDRA